MVAEVFTATRRPSTKWPGLRAGYFRLMLALTLTVALASFIRDRGVALEHFPVAVPDSVRRVTLADRDWLSNCAVSADRFSGRARAAQHTYRHEDPRLGLSGCGLLPSGSWSVGAQAWLEERQAGSRSLSKRAVLLFMHGWLFRP